jgi:hypothetical protein
MPISGGGLFSVFLLAILWWALRPSRPLQTRIDLRESRRETVGWSLEMTELG